jgi:hypothetical protein
LGTNATGRNKRVLPAFGWPSLNFGAPKILCLTALQAGFVRRLTLALDGPAIRPYRIRAAFDSLYWILTNRQKQAAATLAATGLGGDTAAI